MPIDILPFSLILLFGVSCVSKRKHKGKSTWSLVFMSFETRAACHRSFSNVVTWRDVLCCPILKVVAAVLGVKRQTTAVCRQLAVWGSMMSAADPCGWACCWPSWGAAATSPGMCAVNDFWEDIYLYQDIVLRRTAVGSWRYFRLQLPHVTGCCSTCQSYLMPPHVGAIHCTYRARGC